MGIIDEIFFGFGLILDFPIGICILEAYLYKSSIGPKDCKFLTLSAFKALPLYPLIDLDNRAFLSDPV